MPRGKQGLKSGRKERNIAFQHKLRARKRLRKQRAEQFAHLPGQQAQIAPVAVETERSWFNRADLDKGFTVGELRDLARQKDLPVRSRDRKSDIIDMLLGEHPRLSS